MGRVAGAAAMVVAGARVAGGCTAGLSPPPQLRVKAALANTAARAGRLVMLMLVLSVLVDGPPGRRPNAAHSIRTCRHAISRETMTELEALGWDSFFAEPFREHEKDGCVPGRVASAQRDIY